MILLVHLMSKLVNLFEEHLLLNEGLLEYENLRMKIFWNNLNICDIFNIHDNTNYNCTFFQFLEEIHVICCSLAEKYEINSTYPFLALIGEAQYANAKIIKTILFMQKYFFICEKVTFGFLSEYLMCSAIFD